MNWSDGANWQGGVAPGSSSFDTVLTFSGTSPYTLRDGGLFELNSLIFGGLSSNFTIGSPSTNGTLAKGDGPLVFNTDSGGNAPTITLSGKSGMNTINVPIVLDATLTINGTSSTVALTLAGVISGAGGLTMSNPGTVTLTGNNTYTGGTSVATGTLVESNNGNALSTGTVDIAAGATLALSNTNAAAGVLQEATTFSGAGTLQKLGAGTVYLGGNGGNVNVGLGAGGVIDVEAGTLQGSNSYNGVYTQNLGSLNIAAGATFNGEEGTIIVDALTGAGTLKGGYNGTSSTTIGVNNGSGTFTGIIRDSGDLGGTLALIKAGTGTQTLTGANTYTGGTTIKAGTLALGNGGSLGGNITLADSNVSTSGGAIIVAAGTLLVGSGGSLNGGSINDTDKHTNLTVNGTGSVTLSGTLTVNGGLPNGTIGGMPMSVPPATATLADSGQISVPRVNVYNGTINQNGGTLTTTSLYLNAADANGGVTTVYALNGGTLEVGQIVVTPANTNSSTTFDFNGGTLAVTAGDTNFLGGVTTASVQAGGALINTNGNNLTLSQALTTGTASGTPDGGLTKFGAGTLALTANNTYTGGTHVEAGTLVESNNGRALSTGTVTIDTGATLALSNTSTSTSIGQGAITFTGSGTLQKTDAGIVQLGGNGGNVNVSLSAGALIEVEQGVLNASASYNGIYVNNFASLNVASGATFDSVEADVRVDALTGAGTLQGGYTTVGTTTIGVANSSGTFTGTIQDNGNSGGKLTLIKTGTGTQTLSGTSSTYTGGTTINAGRLVELNSGNALGFGTTSIGSGATLELGNTSTSTTVSQVGGTTFSGAGTLQKTGVGTVQFGGNGGNVNVSLGAGGLIDVEAGTLAGSSSRQGFFTNNQASLYIAYGATFDGVEGAVRVDALTGSGTLQGGYDSVGSVTLGVANGDGTFSGSLRDSGNSGGKLTLIKIGTGTQVLGGTSNYTGTTTINGGILRINNGGGTDLNKAGQLAGTSGITINSGGTLTFSGASSVSDRLNNGAAVTINGGGTLSTGGYSEGTAPTGAGGAGGMIGVGALTLSGASSSSLATLDFGRGTNGSALVFSSLTAGSKLTYVNLLDWTGVAGSDNGSARNDRLLFATDPGFSAAQLAQVQFYNDNGTAFAIGALEISYDGYTEIVPVPEPATWLAGTLTVLLGSLTLCRRRCVQAFARLSEHRRAAVVAIELICT